MVRTELQAGRGRGGSSLNAAAGWEASRKHPAFPFGQEQEHLGATGVGVLYPASPNGRSLSAMQASHTDPSIDEDSASLQPITTLF